MKNTKNTEFTKYMKSAKYTKSVKSRRCVCIAAGIFAVLAIPFPVNAAENSALRLQKLNGAIYCVENDTAVTGWRQLDGDWYYFDPQTSAMRTGWIEADGKWYYTDTESGKMKTGWFKDESETSYYFYEDGSMAANAWVDGFWLNADGSWDPDRKEPPAPAAATGQSGTQSAVSRDPASAGLFWQDGGWAYTDSDGQPASGWRTLNGARYYFNDGLAAVGWQYIDGYKYYFNESTCELIQNLDGILPVQSSYHITVDRARCQITVYAPDGENGYIIPCRTFICSPGKTSTPTPVGNFATTAKYRWHVLDGPSYGQYCTRIGRMRILFHSVPGSNATSYNISASKYNKLGEPASGGCIRMTVADAKWIYDNCGLGTSVTIGDSLAAPFDKPEGIKIPAGQNWDPTDPALQ